MGREATKERKFVQTVELQIGLKDYDPQKDKRFVGTVRLPNSARPNLKICLIADEKHRVEATKDLAALGNFHLTSLDELKKFNKDKKLVKKWAKQFDLLLASDTVLKRVPVVVGPILLPPPSTTPELPLSSSSERSPAWVAPSAELTSPTKSSNRTSRCPSTSWSPCSRR